jgi:hypothetical protein
MAFTDWEFFESGIWIHAIDITDQLKGNGSLYISSSGSGDRTLNYNVTVGSGISQGFPHGKIRALFNVESYTAGFRIGIVALQSVQDITTTGEFYAAVVRSRDGSGVDFRLELEKYMSGLNGGGTILNTTGDGNSTLGTTFALELIWNANAPGGTSLQLNFANNVTDFTTLVPSIAYLDMLSPLTSSVSEGGFVRLITSGSEQVAFRMDTTELYSIVP